MKKSLTLCAIFMGLLHILFYIFLDDIFYLMGAMMNTWQKPWRMAPSRLPPST